MMKGLDFAETNPKLAPDRAAYLHTYCISELNRLFIKNTLSRGGNIKTLQFLTRFCRKMKWIRYFITTYLEVLMQNDRWKRELKIN